MLWWRLLKVQCVRELSVLRCLATVCSATPSIQRRAWSPTENVSNVTLSLIPFLNAVWSHAFCTWINDFNSSFSLNLADITSSQSLSSLIIYHSLSLSLQTQNPCFFRPVFLVRFGLPSRIYFRLGLNLLDTGVCLFVLVSSFMFFFVFLVTSHLRFSLQLKYIHCIFAFLQIKINEVMQISIYTTHITIHYAFSVISIQKYR